MVVTFEFASGINTIANISMTEKDTQNGLSHTYFFNNSSDLDLKRKIKVS